MEYSTPLRIDIGCGKHKEQGTIGVDSFAYPGVDVVADINHGLPFPTDTVQEVYAYHVLEHVDNFVFIMEEIWRVTKNGARVHVKIPHASCPLAAWSDPTHRRALTLQTFDYFDERRAPFQYHFKAQFHIASSRLNISIADPKTLGIFRRSLTWIFNAIFNRSLTAQRRAERWVAPWLGIEEAEIELLTVK